MKLLTDFVLVTGLVVMIIIIFFLLKKKNRELPQNLLVVFFLSMFLITLSAYSYLHKIQFLFLFTFIPQDSIELFAGPLLFIYVKSLFHAPQGLIKKHLHHFIPLFIYLAFASIPVFISLLIGDYLFSYLKPLTGKHEYLLFIPHATIFIIYCILSLRLLINYRKKVKLNYSTLDEKDLSWIQHFLISLLIIGSINLFISMYELFFSAPEWTIEFLTYYAIVIMVIYLGYYGTSQSRIILPEFIINETPPTPIENSIKTNPTKSHHLSNATVDEINGLKNRLQEVLKKDKPYLNEDLTLSGLAQLIPTTDKKLSALLNHELEITFYDLINSYRVEDVKFKLKHKDYQEYTLLAIAYESGFKSKTSFNRIFKKSTGRSPSEFKKTISA